MVSKHSLTSKVKKMFVLLTGVVFVTVIVFWATGRLADRQEGDERQSAGLPVETVRVTEGNIKRTLDYFGTIQPEKEVKLAPKIMSEIKSINASEGEFVKRGEVLVTLDSGKLVKKTSKLEKSLNKSKVDLNHWEKELETFKQLAEKGAVSRHEYENVLYKKKKAEAAVEEVRAALKEAEQALDDAVIRSPLDGTITARDAEEGDLVSPGKAVLKIADMSSLKVQVNVIEQDLTKIKRGDRAIIKCPGLDKEIVSQVRKINPALSSVSRSAVVEIDIPGVSDREGVLLPGMSADVNFVLEEKKDTLLVPANAVRNRNGKSFIFIVENKRAVKREVTTGIKDKRQVEIAGDVSTGHQVIVDPPPELYDGKRLYITKGESTS